MWVHDAHSSHTWIWESCLSPFIYRPGFFSLLFSLLNCQPDSNCWSGSGNWPFSFFSFIHNYNFILFYVIVSLEVWICIRWKLLYYLQLRFCLQHRSKNDPLKPSIKRSINRGICVNFTFRLYINFVTQSKLKFVKIIILNNYIILIY